VRQRCAVQAWLSDVLLMDAEKNSTVSQISALGEGVVMNIALRYLHHLFQHDAESGPLVNVSSDHALRLLVAVSCR
jgi:hypothetical protein